MAKKETQTETPFPDVAETIASAQQSLMTHCGGNTACECSQIVVFRQTVLDLIQIAEAYDK
jgi:hypothetical protein